MARLAQKHVLVAGLGGVGAAAAEMICRAGIGRMTIVDADTVEPSNRNRQLCALTSTHGMLKAEVMGQRLKDINPDLDLRVVPRYLREQEVDELLDEAPYDYLADCIDTLSPKVSFIHKARQRGLSIVSSMGAGGKTDPMQVRLCDISETYNCNLARYVRKRLVRMGIREGLEVVFSPEQIDETRVLVTPGMRNKKSVIGTISYLPSLFGCFVASVVVRALAEIPVPEFARKA